ncbi:MAG: DUF4365 domain-containing protein, partial [Muribaculaceae bacterium]
GEFVCVQVKTGKSFYDESNHCCTIPIGKHREYWKSTKLPVFGIVCVADKDTSEITVAYWVDIKEFLINYPEANTITFKACDYNIFDKYTLTTNFYKSVFKSELHTELTFEDALNLLLRPELKEYGFVVLGSKFSSELSSWQKIFFAYENSDACLNLAWFYDALTYLFSHPDHWLMKDNYEFGDESKNYILNKISKFNICDVMKMLTIIDEDEIQRGSIGQSIEILISHINDFELILAEILKKDILEENIKNRAEIILAYHNNDLYLKEIESVKEKSEFTTMILEIL